MFTYLKRERERERENLFDKDDRVAFRCDDVSNPPMFMYMYVCMYECMSVCM